MGKLKELEKKLEERSRRNQESIEKSKAEIKEGKQGLKNEWRNREKPTDQEKFYKNANTTLKMGVLLWALPGLFVICTILLFVGFGIWEWLF
ncbi:hypothetical protein LF817_11335 [Halobacillus sp. A1]|uniref:hypothetical protein n=1 Tax=Halobacillus sp. A1 TaxID=2880262 RepID=UPI0020A6926D|nr:hypothetical protein [Halobacillus sp. A1]MCP3031938.1 hypothetical protein [Halobacillus sp. A1]